MKHSENCFQFYTQTFLGPLPLNNFNSQRMRVSCELYERRKKEAESKENMKFRTLNKLPHFFFFLNLESVWENIHCWSFCFSYKHNSFPNPPATQRDLLCELFFHCFYNAHTSNSLHRHIVLAFMYIFLVKRTSVTDATQMVILKWKKKRAILVMSLGDINNCFPLQNAKILIPLF